MNILERILLFIGLIVSLFFVILVGCFLFASIEELIKIKRLTSAEKKNSPVCKRCGNKLSREEKILIARAMKTRSRYPAICYACYCKYMED